MSGASVSRVTLAPGTRLGPYEIVALLGSGGMGDVYRARDPRLGRDVALKVLPGSSEGDSGRFRRFQTEAKAAAALSHAHIVAVHDVGEADGTAYIVSELVPGGTLTALLERGPLPVKRLLDLAVPLAEALAAAHAAGIVHRDLKPDNILLAQDGRPKIADFGLAKYLAPIESGSNTAGSTLDDDRTREGTVFGTVGYMSPEQAAGKPLDFRSDQFSFGSVLYEMATGARAFRGNTAVDTLAAILHEEPEPIDRSNPAVPAPLRWTIERCLAKDPAGRYDSSADLARELAKIREHLTETMTGANDEPAPRRRRLAFVVAAAALLGTGLVAARLLPRPAAATLPSFQQLTFRRGGIFHARYTPDGGSVVYAAAWDGSPSEIYEARLDGTESRRFGVEKADVLAVSPKGELAVLLKKTLLHDVGGTGTLAVVPLSGGVPRELVEDVSLADYGPDGTQLAIARKKGLETAIEYPIGSAIYTTAKFCSAMRVSPDGKQIAFVETNDAYDFHDLKVVDVAGGTESLLLHLGEEGLDNLVWTSGGREILTAVNKGAGGDSSRLVSVDMHGRARTLYSMPIFTAVWDSRSDGSLLVEHSKTATDVIAASSAEPAGRNLSSRKDFIFDDMSEDGEWLLFHDKASSYLRVTDGAPAVRLASGTWGTISPDEKFVVLRASEHEIGIVPIKAGQSRTISIGELVLEPHPRILSDGHTLLFGAVGDDGKDRLYVMDANDGKPPRLVSGPIEHLGWTVTSPDEKEVAVGDPTNGLQIFRLDGSPARKIAGLDPDDEVYAWSTDARSLYTAKVGDVPLRVELFDLASGEKTLWKSLSAPDLGGAFWAGFPAISRDGRFWAYQVNRTISDDLWQIKGLAPR
jgi:eukaryotic-like serine/threonine-protein kinase